MRALCVVWNTNLGGKFGGFGKIKNLTRDNLIKIDILDLS